VTKEKFRPGFRLSLIDAIVVAVGVALSILLWNTAHIGIMIAFVVGHFFLFCNVFRIARRLELIWSGVFVACICATTMLEAITFPLALVVSSIATISCCGDRYEEPIVSRRALETFKSVAAGLVSRTTIIAIGAKRGGGINPALHD